MERSDEKRSEGAIDGTVPAAADRLANESRRRFSRNAIAGGAVLLSLGNRSAWGMTGTQVAGCMSLNTVNSFNPETGMFVSTPGAGLRPDHNEELAAEIHRIADPPDYTGRIGEWAVCEDPNSLDGVCLVRGLCPE